MESKKSHLHNVLTRSSLIAVSKLGSSNSKYIKCYWIIVLIFCTLGCSYEAYRYLDIYFDYPVLINREVESQFMSEFPAVTVCNLNRAKDKFEDCINKGNHKYQCSIVKQHIYSVSETHRLFYIFDALETLNETDKRKSEIVLKWDDEIANKTYVLQNNTSFKFRYIPRDKFYQEFSTFLTKFLELNELFRKDFGYEYHEFIQGCTFSKKTCNKKDFSLYQNLHFGNCFTFNENPQIKLKSKAGLDNGLELILNINRKTYLRFTDALGVRVVIHSSDEEPNPSDHGFNIPPGFESQLSMTKTSIHRLPPPYRDKCFQYDRTSDDPSKRSLVECSWACNQNISFSRCFCTDPGLPQYRDTRTCSFQNLTEFYCLKKVQEYIRSECRCPLPCETSDFKLSISASKIHSLKNDTDTEDVVKLKIYFANSDHIIYSQNPTYTMTEMLAHFGGILGLWLGVSMLVLYENVESIFILAKLSFGEYFLRAWKNGQKAVTV